MSKLLIVLEGLDCSGKSTISAILKKRIEPCTLYGFPDRNTEIGKLIDRFLKKEIHFSPHALHLLYSANRYEKEDALKQALENSHVICDRYWLSGAVYSAAKDLDYYWAKQCDCLLPMPDITFFIDTPVEETSKRRDFGKEAHDKIDFQAKVRGIYKEKCKEEGVFMIDGSKSPDEIVEEMLKVINSKLQSINK